MSAVEMRWRARITAAAARGRRQRLLGKRLEVIRLVAGQNQIDGKRERRIDRQQLAVAAEIQRRQPGRLACRALLVMPVGRTRLRVFGVLSVFDGSRGGFAQLERRKQRADMNHQHGEQAKPDTDCRQPFACHRRFLGKQ